MKSTSARLRHGQSRWGYTPAIVAGWVTLLGVVLVIILPACTAPLHPEVSTVQPATFHDIVTVQDHAEAETQSPVVSAPAPPSDDAGALPPPSTPAPRPPIVERVPDTAIELELVSIDGDDDVAPFYVSRTEIPWDLYDVFVFKLDQTADDGADAITRPSKPYIAMDRGFGHAGYPAISISAHGARMFCAWLSRKTGRAYRLPSEAEWRHLCATSGIGESMDDHAWHAGNAEYATHRVGKKKPDANGLFDLHGNAMEWVSCDDGESACYGGSYRDPAGQMGCTLRRADNPDWNASDPQFPKSIWWLADGGFVGFRVVCDIKEQDMSK